MPNRIIKESICYSEDIRKLEPMEEIFFYRLIVNCDDYGRCDARPQMLKAKLFPLDENVKSDDIIRYLMKSVDVGLVALYQNDGMNYLFLPKWEKHQQVRAKRSKYPDPLDSRSVVISHDIICNQEISDDSICHRESLSESLSESIIVEQSPTRNTPYELIVNLFHEICVTLPAVKILSDSRKSSVRQRFKEFDIDKFESVFRKVNDSEFLSGRNGKWTNCNFDWIMKQSNFIKILEGNYDNKNATNSPQGGFYDVLKQMYNEVE